MISSETIEAINRSVKLVDLIGASVELKKRGNSYIGLCPFHNERSPSFHVKEDQDYYHCFGCGASGGAITFIMQTKGLSFPEAVEYLAQQLGIPIKETTGFQKNENRQIKKDLLRVNDLTQRFFKESLARAPQAVKDYLASRNLSEQQQEIFQVGFAPLDWQALSSYLSKMKVSEELMLSSGLVKRNVKGELYGFYRGRLTFPIINEAKRIIGFGARVIPKLFSESDLESQAKYLNSPETALYFKSKVLYGIDQALEAIKKERQVYVVEGYLDVIGMNAGQVKNVVATCGTALTKDHLRRLARLTSQVKLLFDGDHAGREAAAKCFATFLNSGVDVQAIFLPQGADPHSMYQSHGSALATKLKDCEHKSLLNCYLISLIKKEGAESLADLGPAVKSRLAENIAAMIEDVTSPIEKEQLIKELCFLMELSSEIKQALFKNTNKPELYSVVMSSATVSRQFQAAPAATNNILGGDRPSFTPEIARQVKELEKNIIRLVIANRNRFPAMILNDANFCSLIGQTCLAFVESVKSIALAAEFSEDEKKSAVRDLIASSGSDFMSLWKETREMIKDISVDFEKIFQQTSLSAQRLSIKRASAEIDEALKSVQNEAEKIELIKQKMELQKLARQ